MPYFDVEVVDLRLVPGLGNLRAFADVKFGGVLLVRGFSVLKGRSGLFVSVPRKASKDGKWFDMLKPLDDDLKDEIERLVLKAYKDAGGDK